MELLMENKEKIIDDYFFICTYVLYTYVMRCAISYHLLQPNLLRSKQNFMKISHQMYNSTLTPYLCKSKYRSYRAPFEYSLAFKMVTKPTSTLSGHFYVYTSLHSDIYNCTQSIIDQNTQQVFLNFSKGCVIEKKNLQLFF